MLKVMCLASSVVLVIVSMTVCQLAMLGTLNLTMLRWTDVGYESRM